MPYSIEVSGQLREITPGLDFEATQIRVAADEADHYGVAQGTVIDRITKIPAASLATMSDADRARYLIQTTPISTDAAKAQQLAAVAAKFNDLRQSAMSWNFGAVEAKDELGESHGDAGVQTLQMRDDGVNDDPKNWIAAAASAALSEPTAILPLKVTANLWVQTTAAQVQQVLIKGDGTQTAAFTRQLQMLARYGALKAAINAAQDAAAAQAIDITTGWPA